MPSRPSTLYLISLAAETSPVITLVAIARTMASAKQAPGLRSSPSSLLRIPRIPVGKGSSRIARNASREGSRRRLRLEGSFPKKAEAIFILRPRLVPAKLCSFRISSNRGLDLAAHDSRPVQARDDVAGTPMVLEQPVDPL